MAIYREGGILKRLRATPLRPHTILTAHVLVKLLFSAITRERRCCWPAGRIYPAGPTCRWCRLAWRWSSRTASVLSLGFLIASVVPTARFAQPFGAMVLYPMLGAVGAVRAGRGPAAGLQAVARVLPLTYAVSLLRGIWHGEGWATHPATSPCCADLRRVRGARRPGCSAGSRCGRMRVSRARIKIGPCRSTRFVPGSDSAPRRLTPRTMRRCARWWTRSNIWSPRAPAIWPASPMCSGGSPMPTST